MPVPPFIAFGLPTLQALGSSPIGLRKGELIAQVAVASGLTDAELAETIPSGQPAFENRIGWLCSWMKKKGWVENPRRAHWQITEAGAARLATGLPFAFAEFRGFDGKSLPTNPAVAEVEEVARTPQERIADALTEIVDDLRATLRERIAASSPLFFERLVLKLLTRMGYAGNLGRSEHSGKTGDGGIDGILYLDRLGLERVYVQAKRWQGSVGAMTIRDFAGSMDAEAATKGVILTTSTFTADAKRYVEKSPKAIRLVDGEELTRLLVEFEVGAARETTIVIPRLDEDVFDEG